MKDTALKRSESVYLRLRPAEKSDIERAAECAQKRVPEFVRDAVLAAARRTLRGQAGSQ